MKYYVLMRDNDGHWYVVPEDNMAEFSNWLDLDPDDPASWDPPGCCEMVGGAPSLVKFAQYRID